MKLYTEQQVKQFLKERTFIREDTIDAMCDTLIPIELPSDEEIEKQSKKLLFEVRVNNDLYNEAINEGFFLGVEYMKEQIVKKNK